MQEILGVDDIHSAQFHRHPHLPVNICESGDIARFQRCGHVVDGVEPKQSVFLRVIHGESVVGGCPHPTVVVNHYFVHSRPWQAFVVVTFLNINSVSRSDIDDAHSLAVMSHIEVSVAIVGNAPDAVFGQSAHGGGVEMPATAGSLVKKFHSLPKGAYPYLGAVGSRCYCRYVVGGNAVRVFGIVAIVGDFSAFHIV